MEPENVLTAGSEPAANEKTAMINPGSASIVTEPFCSDKIASRINENSAAAMVARLLANQPVPDELAPESFTDPVLAKVWQAGHGLEGKRRTEAARAALEVLDTKERQRVTAICAAIDLDEEPKLDEQPLAWMIDSDVPDLPKAAQMKEGLAANVGGWLDTYVDYAMEVSERTPAEVHQSAGLWAVSVAIARRLHLPMRHGDVFSNLYVLTIAETSLRAKTTGMGVMTGLVDEAIPHLLLSNESTPEALISELAGKEPVNLNAADVTQDERDVWRKGQAFAAQRGLVLEEASALLAGLKRDYMLGMAELLLRLHDCPVRYRRHTRGGGYAVIRNASLSIFGWTTPSRLQTAELDVAWHDGLFARFALLTPNEPPRRPAVDGYLKLRPQRPRELLEDLSRLANVLLEVPEFPQPVTSKQVAIEVDAKAAWWRYYTACSHDLLTSSQPPDRRLWGTYSRLPAMALKVALLLAAIDWAGQRLAVEPTVTLAHYARAQQITEGWRASAHRLLDTLSTRPEAEAEQNDLDRVLRALQKRPGQWLTIRDVTRVLGSNRYTTSAVKSLVDTLEQDGRVELENRSPVGRGRPTMVYRITSG